MWDSVPDVTGPVDVETRLQLPSGALWLQDVTQGDLATAFDVPPGAYSCRMYFDQADHAEAVDIVLLADVAEMR